MAGITDEHEWHGFDAFLNNAMFPPKRYLVGFSNHKSSGQGIFILIPHKENGCVSTQE